MKNTTEEIWKDIPGHNGYQASNKGRVRSLVRTIEYVRCGKKLKRTYHQERILKQSMAKGYKQCGLGTVHRMVALAWIPNEDPETKTVVNHKDENKLNNTPENLEWLTPIENMEYGTARERAALHRTLAYKDLMKQLEKMDKIFPGFKEKALLFLE